MVPNFQDAKTSSVELSGLIQEIQFVNDEDKQLCPLNRHFALDFTKNERRQEKYGRKERES